MSKAAMVSMQTDPWAAAEEMCCRHCGEDIRPDEPEILVLRADSLEVGRFHRWGCGVMALEWSRPRSPEEPPDLLFMISPTYRTNLPSHLLPIVSGKEGRFAGEGH